MGTRVALLLATMGTAACGGAEAVESTTPRPSDAVATTVTIDAPTTTLGDPSTTVIETTVPPTDAPTTTVAETTTTAFDASSVVPDLKPSVDISTPLGMALTIQAISGGYLYTWDGYNNVEIDFTTPDVTRPVSDTDRALARAIYSSDLESDGLLIGDKFIRDLEGDKFDEGRGRFYPITGIDLVDATYGPIAGTQAVLDLPDDATDRMLRDNEGLRKAVDFYGDRVQVTSYGVYWEILGDSTATVLTPEADYAKPSPTMAFVLDVVTIVDDNGVPKYAGFLQSRVAAVWSEDGKTYDNVSTRSPRTGAIVSPDGKIEAAVL